MSTSKSHQVSPSGLLHWVLAGGILAGTLDAADALIAYKLALGFDPVPIYQFVASGLLGARAYQLGLSSALLGLAIHFLIAFTAAWLYVQASFFLPALRQRYVLTGLLFGIAVWVFMNLAVIPLSRIPPSPFYLPLSLNGVIGHALFVGLPISWAAQRYVSKDDFCPKAQLPAASF